MDKKQLLKCVRNRLSDSDIKFPEGIDFQESDRVITLIMSDGVTKNMQEDSAAFEGWALCVKAAMEMGKKEETYKFVLEWDPVNNPDDLHYQRFLYRVCKFVELFGGVNGWFAAKRVDLLHDLRVKDGEKYMLNFPKNSDEERINYSDESEENRLENEIVRMQDKIVGLKRICPAKLNRQLPMGLFKGNVRKGGEIFPRGKSAIDLWGIIGKDLYVFELKAKGNCKVGVLSELFFYVMMLKDEQTGKFVRDSSEGKRIRKTNQIKAFILAHERHPLITAQVFYLLNEAMRKRVVKFGYIKIDATRLKFKKEF